MCLKFVYVVTRTLSGEPKNGGPTVIRNKIFSVLQNIKKCSEGYQAFSKLVRVGCYPRRKATGGVKLTTQLHGMSRLRGLCIYAAPFISVHYISKQKHFMLK